MSASLTAPLFRLNGEAACVAVSEELVFLEHEMYQQLRLRLKVGNTPT